jgi:hypothetical protein
MKILFIALTATVVMFNFIVSCNPAKTDTHKRPLGVPNTANWAGGIDGGYWFNCTVDSKALCRYTCAVYNEHNGEIISQGQYLLYKQQWDVSKKTPTYLKVDQPVPELRYRNYDGTNINLENSLILLPQGWIIYPFDKSHGKKQKYEKGVPVSKEIQY